MQKQLKVGEFTANLKMCSHEAVYYYEIDNKYTETNVYITGAVSMYDKSVYDKIKIPNSARLQISNLISACQSDFETFFTRTELLLRIVDKMKSMGLKGSAMSTLLKRMDDFSIRVLLGIAFGNTGLNY